MQRWNVPYIGARSTRQTDTEDKSSTDHPEASKSDEFKSNRTKRGRMQQSGESTLAASAQQPRQQPELNFCELLDLRPSVKSHIHTKFIILEKGPTSRLKWGPLVSEALVADSTAAVNLDLWGRECDAFQPSDIVRLTNGHFSYQKHNKMVLRAGEKGQLEKIGEFSMTFVETPNMSRVQWVPDPSNSKLLVPNSRGWATTFHEGGESENGSSARK